jgi:choline dehydrogenase
MEFDYVIVGGGSAGCVLANRLSEDQDVSVCLIEAGPPDVNPVIHVPLGILWMMRSAVLNWRYETAPEPQLGGRQLFWPRGRTLGGSSSSNAMLYIRGHASDYDKWAALGNRGWSYADVLPYFIKAEHNERGASLYHGASGPLNVADLRSPNELSLAFVEAAQQAGLPLNPDFNGAEQEGTGLYQVTQRNGERWSAARAYLDPVRHRSNLHVLTRTHATRVLTRGRRAIGVEFRIGGRYGQAMARREVLVCGGAINSPQLLMLSGIGPAGPLRDRGLRVVHNLLGVGQNLQDHLDVTLVNASRLPVSWGFTPRMLRGGLFVELWRYLSARRGMLSSTGAEACAFARSSPGEPLPDLQFHFTPARQNDHGRDLRFLMGEGYSLHVCNLRPKSRGEIRLSSIDPAAKPHIHANYLSEAEDMEKMLAGVKWVRRIFESSAFDRYRGKELVPGHEVQTDEDLMSFIRARAETIYHPVGTCRMGTDALAVVDPELRVRGMEALRVVDASVMPTLVGGNTNAPVIMIAEKAADMVKAARQAILEPAVTHGPRDIARV